MRPNRDLGFSAFAFVLALLPRLYVAIAWPREPVWDGHYYDFGARRIAAGLGYSDGTAAWHPWCHWPVGYSGLLAGLYRVFGDGPRVATVAGAVIGATVVVLVHRVARFALSVPRARVAALLAALHPGLVAYAALVMTEPLSSLLLLFGGWLALRALDRSPLRAALPAGAVLGLGTLVRPTFLALAPALALLHTRRGAARALAIAALATASALVVVAPWTLRNCRVMDRCALVSTNGGWNLAIGAFPRATGRFETLRASDGCAVVTGQVQQDACWRERAFEWIAKDPVRWLGLVPTKLGFLLDQESFPVEYLHEADPDRWPDARRQRARELLTAFHRALLTVAAFAFVARTGGSARGRAFQAALALATGALATLAWSSDSSPFWPLAVVPSLAYVAAVPGSPARSPAMTWVWLGVVQALATHAVFFGEDRYHVVVAPLLCVLAAAAFRAPDDGEPVQTGRTDQGMLPDA